MSAYTSPLTNDVRTPNIDEDDAGGLDLLQMWRSIAKRKFQIIALAAVAAVLAYVIASRITPIFESHATVVFETRKANVVSIDQAFTGVSPDQQHFQTQTEILRSRDLALKTIKRLRLWEHPDYDPRIEHEDLVRDLLARWGLGDFFNKPSAAPAEWNDALLAEAVYGAFAAALKVEPLGRNTQIVTIRFTSPDQALSARVANIHAESYIADDLDARFEMSNSARLWLRERLSELKAQLTASEQALQQFRESKGLIDISGSAQTGVSQQTTDLRTRLIDAQVRRAEVEIAYQQIRAAGKEADLSALPAIQRNTAVASARGAFLEAERKVAELAERYGPEHPRMLQVQAERASARTALQSQVNLVVASITREFEQARAQEQALQRSLDASEESVRRVNRYEFDLGVLQREVESNRQLYDMFLSRGKETDIASDLQNPVARIIDRAVSGSQIAPQVTRTALVVLAVALLLGCAAAVLVDQLDKTIKTVEDAERKLQQPLLASLPVLERKNARRGTACRMLLDHPDSVFAEAIRTARSGILLSALDATQRTILVTSSLPGEGKTVFAMGVAEALAQQGSRTLLLECDMRRPSIARALDLDPGVAGLSALVAGTAGIEDCVRQLPDSALDIIVTGTVPPNPQELLASRRFRTLLDALKERYEVIIIDSAPIELVADAAVLAPLCTGVAYVVKSAETPAPLAVRGLTHVRRAGGQVLGLVLSQLDHRRAHRYYGEYSGYGMGGYYRYGEYRHAYGSRREDAAAGKA